MHIPAVFDLLIQYNFNTTQEKEDYELFINVSSSYYYVNVIM